MIGFGMFAFVADFWLFAAAVVVITIGEMVIMPTSSALATNFAPEDMRGRYMAVLVFPGLFLLLSVPAQPVLFWITIIQICSG